MKIRNRLLLGLVIGVIIGAVAFITFGPVAGGVVGTAVVFIVNACMAVVSRKTKNKFLLACEGVMAKKARTFMLALGVSVGTAALVFLVSLIFGAKFYVDRTVGTIRENLLVVKTKEKDSTPTKPLDDRAYGAIEAKIGPVKGIYRELPIQPKPSIIIKNITTSSGVTDLGPLVEIVGMDTGLFKERIREFKYNKIEPVDESKIEFPSETEPPEKLETDDYVPILVPNFFMELVNNVFPTESSSIGEQFRKYIKEKAPFYIVLENHKAYRCKVIAEDNSVSRFSIAIPFQYAEEWNRELRPEKPLPDYSRFVVEANDIKDLDFVKEQIITAGYQPQPTEVQELSIVVSRGATYLFAVAVTFCLVIALVSAIGIFNGLSISIMEQAPRIGILRSVGGTKNDISSIYLFEAAIIGVVGGIIGLVAAHLFMWGSDIALRDFLSDVTNLRGIDTLFTWSLPQALYIRLGAIGLGVFTSLFAGVGPAYRASKLNPAVVLRAG
jgi:putative ABC transport system permease protein